ncbi:MAG: hydrogenase maturation nickel metallochaperone HypA [Deltaproteobacteria bacterium]|nr:hydrogenase maturation nickel metallochaperone HypA [Deltaproteobacteria bacterium]
MHEGHLTKTIIEVVKREFAALGGKRLKSVTLKLGEASGIEPESVRFYLSQFLKDPAMQATEVVIERAKGTGVEVVSIETE